MKFLSMIFFLFLFIWFFGCDINEEPEEGAIKYLFVEHHIRKHGVLLSGPQPPLLQIDFPTYILNTDSAILTGMIDFKIDDNLKIIFGSGTCLSGTAGGGCGTVLSGVYSLPFKREMPKKDEKGKIVSEYLQRGKFEILKLHEKGKIDFEYYNTVNALNAGEEWIKEIIYNDTIAVNEKQSISKIKVTERIINFGFIESSKIRKLQPE